MRKLIKNITDRYKHAKMKNQLIIMYLRQYLSRLS